ncbi:MAG: DUF4145 domain-containing protein [Syntrophaceae bacterium]|nr:DUF4145 domain-containing protein [Syntrophaceae bacterium]
MGFITRDCPHCHSNKMTFSAFGEYKIPREVTKPHYLTAFRCGGCHGGYFIRTVLERDDTPINHNGDIDCAPFIKILQEYPLEKDIEIPEYFPENICNFFIQAAKSLRLGNLDASAMMSRKVLEVSVKSLDKNGKGNLYQRIEKLYNDGIITENLKDWAHIIRDDGNEAAHEEVPVNPDFAKQLLSFTEMFLMYTFTLPGMVKDKRKNDVVEGEIL